MATDVTPVALGPPVPAAGDRERRAGCAREAPTGNAAVIAQIVRRLNIALPVINGVCAAITYVFVTDIVQLPKAPTGSLRIIGLVASVSGFAICWVVCALWGRRSFAPVQGWLEEDRDPTASERDRTVRIPLHEARHALAIWMGAGATFSALDTAFGGSLAAGALVFVLVIQGGLVSASLTYLASEAIMRPAIAMALSSDPPARPLLPGIAARIYLAWEVGTAAAVIGAVVTSIAYLAGAGIGPDRLAITVIFLGGIALTVGLFTLLAAIWSVAAPVRALRGAMARLEQGETNVTLPVDDGGEVGLLQAGFNRMVAGLRERDHVRQLFGRHVGEEVAQSALEREPDLLDGEVREAAVLFADVIGSTAFAAATAPREVVQTLNRFFSILVEVVTVHGGWVNKFEGDAALCVFGAPTEHPDAAGAALAAARSLQRRLQGELDGLDIAIGLSAGRVVAGNLGAAERYEYTVIGDPVNEASRLTELAKTRECRVLASDSIVRRATPAEAKRWQLGEPVQLRGRPAPTMVAAPV